MSDALRLATAWDGYATGDGFQRTAEETAAMLREQHAELTRLRAALSAPPPAVPAGWQLVPVELQTTMIEAVNWLGGSAARGVWAALLNSAPPAPQDSLRLAVKTMAAALQAGEWAEHVSTDPDALALECAITARLGLQAAPQAPPAPPGWITSAVTGLRPHRSSDEQHLCRRKSG